MNIRLQIIFAVLLVALSISALSYGFFTNQARKQELERFTTTIEENSRLLKVVIAEPLYDGNLEQVNIIVESFFSNPEMVLLSLREFNGDIHIEKQRSVSAQAGEFFTSHITITRGIEELGEINLKYSTAFFEQRISASQTQFLIFSFALISVLSLVIYMIARKLTIPIEQLSAAAQIMAGGDLGQEIKVAGAEEFKLLGQSFIRMRDSIREKIEELEASEDKYRSLFQRSVDATLLSQGIQIVDCNLAAVKMFGYQSPDELISKLLPDLSPEYQSDGAPSAEEAIKIQQECFESGSHQFEWLHKRADGEEFFVEVTATLIPLGDTMVFHALLRDITEQKRVAEEKVKLEEQLLQSQKMETIGRLAGGIAHDFNNMLSVIIGSAHLLRKRMPQEGSLLRFVDDIEKAASHSTEVTRQLLAFSRQQVTDPQRVDLNTLIEALKMPMSRILSEMIQVEVFKTKDLWPIRCDPTHLEQILFNLAINSRDAMPDGGKLTIETNNVIFDETDTRHYPDIKPGQFVLLAISDQGIGMDKQTIEHIFEPFFTTKIIGKGTGLGLATVYGIVKQANGFIKVYSEPGGGATFKIYLPRDTSYEQTVEALSVETPIPTSCQLLLVEDDDMVREITKAMLADIGHKVTVTKSPLEAIALFESNPGFDLVLTDVVMPDLNGLEMANRLKEIEPKLKVLFMSGYTQNIIANHGILKEGINLLQKPFSSSVLANKIDEIMASS
ncbi:MAG: ATP-binding protein [Deltaproteobacteria bacterium]|nr:ATP-binding protein [Deltaproteobacteria bacterium]MCW9050076.1 ATP-binding protein [Deltaproteobacteria bacterium]